MDGAPGGGVPLPCQREAFSLPPDLHYLNCAYMSPLPRAVEEAGIRGMRRKRNPAAISPADFFTDCDALRELFADLVNAPSPRDVAILPSVSYGVAVAARNLPLEPGQNIVLTHEQFPGNVYAWRRRARETGAELRVVEPPPGPARGRGWNERLLEAIDASTGVVTLGHVHWTDGTLFDLEAVAARAREVGAALVVDGTQSVGALPFDVERIRPDALICAGYKWLLGPYSVGLGYFGPRLVDGVPLEETWIARRGSDDFRRLVDYQDEYAGGAVRFDVGERSNFILVPMLRAALELLRAWGPDRIQAYCLRLMEPVVAEAREMGFQVEEEWRAGHIFGIRMPAGVDLLGVREVLARHGVSASLRGTALRVSPNVYNDEADAGALLSVLREVAGR